MTSCMIFGPTGLCGFEILQHAIALHSFAKVASVSRRDVPASSAKLTKDIEADTSKYPQLIAAAKPDVVFTALATTRAAAGSAQAFVDVDYGINMEIAKAAKEAGVATFVVVSSVGASASSPFLYMKTKGRLEDDVIALGFPRTIILRPGPLIGHREQSKGFLSDLSSGVFKYAHGTFVGKHLFYPISGAEVGSAAVHLALQPLDAGAKVQIVGGKQLLQLVEEIAKPA